MSDSTSKFEKHVFVDKENITLIDHLHESLPEFSKAKLKKILQSGAVWLTERKSTVRVRRSKRVLKKGSEIHLYYDESVLNQVVDSAILVADEVGFSVWNKPKGMFSQGTKWGDANSICRWVEVNGFPDRPVYQVHRLDRATGGLILVAHKKSIASQLISLFENRKVAKHYHAVVEGIFPAIKIIDDEVDGKSAKTIVLQSEIIKANNQTRLIVSIETGRKHQIRKHLAGLGHPIVGDRMYNENSENAGFLLDLQLESIYLKFQLAEQERIYEIKINA